MNTKIKTALLTAAALLMTAGVSVAAPSKYHNDHGKGFGKPGYGKIVKKHGIGPFERAQIARSSADLASLKRRVWRDGKVSFAERIMVQNAERRHAALVARAYRT